MSVLNTRRRRRSAVVAVVALAAIGGGTAFAYWTADGSGAGNATTGVSTGFTVTAAPPVGAALTPGGPSQSVTYTVANSSTGGEYWDTMFVSVANDDGSQWVAVPGCSAADYTVGTPVFTPVNIPGGESRTGTVTISMVNSNTDQDACQTVDVPLYFTTVVPD